MLCLKKLLILTRRQRATKLLKKNHFLLFRLHKQGNNEKTQFCKMFENSFIFSVFAIDHEKNENGDILYS